MIFGLRKCMKIVIYDDELRSGMQMYLALSNRHQVIIAQDIEDLMLLLDQAAAELTLIDLATKQEGDKKLDGISIAKHIRDKHPNLKLVGICDQEDVTLQKKALDDGIRVVITRPIKNRELLEKVEN